METNLKNLIAIIIVLSLFCGILLFVFYNVLFIPSTNDKCFNFYANKVCEQNNLSYISNDFISPIIGYDCLNYQTNDYNNYEVHMNFTDEQIKQCTIKPIL